MTKRCQLRFHSAVAQTDCVDYNRLQVTYAPWSAQKREAKGLSSRLRASFAEATGERRGVAPGSFVDLLVNATDKATGESLSDLERTNQAFVMVMSGKYVPATRGLSTFCVHKQAP